MVKTNVYKVTIMIVDHDRVGHEGITEVLESARYPNRCIDPIVVEIEGRSVEWSDDHPLNYRDTRVAEFERLFGEVLP